MWQLLILLIDMFIAGNSEAVGQIERSTLRLSKNFQRLEEQNLPSTLRCDGMTFERKWYADFDALEWQVRLRAPINGDVPVFDNLPSADFAVTFPKVTTTTLHSSQGSHGDTTDFRMRSEELTAGNIVSLSSFGGRSSDGTMPYFNLESGAGGLIVAIGWSGDWKATLLRQDDGSIHVTAGLKQAHFRLLNQESVRLPSILIMPYQGSWIQGQNKFRRLMLQYLTPSNHKPMDVMPVAASVHGMIGFNDTSETNLTALATDIAALKLPIDTFWLDAGWNQGGVPSSQGNMIADPTRFPNGLAPISKLAHEEGLRFLAWFEPERVMRNTAIFREHSDWILKPTETPDALRYQESDGFFLFDLGNREAREWMVNNISNDIQTNDIDIYRQDCNLYPSYFWHTDESADQIGLHEVRYITGLYQFLAELQRRHPQLIIDSCAAGGRRLDFEMMRRSVVLWRSDSCWDNATYPRNVQSMTSGLSHWLPLHGLGAAAANSVALRSGMGACSSFAINYRDGKAVASLQDHLKRYLPIRQFFTKDFYPLTDPGDDPSNWLAFQFHDPDKDAGVLQVFRGISDAKSQTIVKLQGLESERRYTITDWDEPESQSTMTGKQLMTDGVTFAAEASIGVARVLEYRGEQEQL